jgi:hypothetical protein
MGQPAFCAPMITSTTSAIGLFGIALLVTGCPNSQPPAAPSGTEPVLTVGSGSAAAVATKPDAEAADDGACTVANLEPLRLALERSCAIRPEFEKDCRALYAPLPVWNFEPSRATDREYCRIERPDATTSILHHRRREPKCVLYAMTFKVKGASWELDSADIDKTCQ